MRTRTDVDYGYDAVSQGGGREVIEEEAPVVVCSG
jgi:hypothetical protein